MSNTTEKLSLNLLSGLEKINKDTFNGIIEDIDNKCVGIHHLHENSHWRLWEKDTDYVKGDIVRTTTCKSNQYFQCIVGGTSGKNEPKNQGTGGQITDNTATWIINEIGSSGGNNGASVFIGSKYYTRGQLAIYNGVLYRSIKDHIAEQTFQLDIANWQKLYSNIREWTDSTFYFSNEIVINDNKLYKCKQDHVSAGTFVSDINAWDSLSSNGIETFKPSTYYNDGAIIVEGNRLYRCTLAHTSTTDLISDTQNWELLSNIQEWESNKTYIQGNIVLYDNTPYKVVKNHVSNDFSLDKDNFEITYSNIRDFNASSYYKAGSYVLYDNNIYKALNDTKGDIGHRHQLKTSASFTDSDGVYTKEIGTDSSGYTLVTEPTGNYINTVIDLGSICDVTQVILSELVSVNCAPNEIVVKTSKDGTDYSEADSYSTGGYSDFKDGTTLNINKKVRYIKLVFKSVYKSNGNMFTFNKVEVYVSNPDWQKITNTQKPSIETWRTGTDYKKNEIVVYNEKIYRCAKDHTSGTDFSADIANWDILNAGLNDWATNVYYPVGIVVLANNKIYQCKSAHTSTTFSADEANWKEISSYTIHIDDWVASTAYKAGDLVAYDAQIYRCKVSHTSSSDFSTDDTKWEILSPTINIIKDWQASTKYLVGNFVIKNDILYECITANTDDTFNPAKWKAISKDGLSAWESNKQYSLYDTVVENEEVYFCIMTHTSSNNFQDDLDANKWKLIGGGSSSEGDGLDQITKLNVVAPLNIDIPIPYTDTFKRPPVEVLKYTQGTTNITTNALTFNAGDGSKFEIDGVTAKDSQLVTFDGVVKPNHDITYPFNTPTLMTTKYYSESEEIDLSDYKVVEEVSLE